MGVLVTQVFNGLSVGSILLLAALGLALTFGQMGVINMAHGEFIMAGCYTAYVVQQVISQRRCLAAGFAGRGIRRRRPPRRTARGHADPADVRPTAGHPAGHVRRRAGAAAGRPRYLRRPRRQRHAPAWLSGGVEILGASSPRPGIFILVLAIVGVTALAAVLKISLDGSPHPRGRCRTATSRRPAASRAARPTSHVLHRFRAGRRRRRRADADRVDEPTTGQSYIDRRVPGGRGRWPRPDQGHGDRGVRPRLPELVHRVQHHRVASPR